jgi:4-azaleucine resistance transporter AzlC
MTTDAAPQTTATSLDTSTPSRAFRLGLRGVMPMHLGVAPFGIIYGVVAVSSGIPALAAVMMSSILFAGSSQFLLAQMIGTATPALVILGAVFLVNLRHALYSASVAPRLEHLPKRWKLGLAYLLTDEAYAGALPGFFAEPRSPNAHWVLLGSGFGLWAGWQLFTIAGVLIGSQMPADLGLEFALPLTFIAIVVPMLTTRARTAAAIIAGVAAIALASLPFKTGLLAATILGLLVGAWFSRTQEAQ